MSATDVIRLRPPTTAGLAALTSSVLAVAALVVCLADDPSVAIDGHVLENAFTAVVWAPLGLLLARKVPGHRFGPLFLVVSGAASAAVASSALALDPARAGAAAADWLGDWVWVIATFVPVTVLPAWFPDAPRGPRRWIGHLGLAGVGLMALGLATDGRIDLTRTSHAANPLAIPASGALFLLGALTVIASGSAAVLTLVQRLVRSSGIARRQLAPVAVAVTVTIPLLVTAGLLGNRAAALQLAVTPLIPAATALAILRYRLYDVEVVLRRTLVFVVLTALILGGYLLIVQATATLLRRTAGLPASIVAVGIIAVAFAPARSVVQRAVGRWVYGERDTPMPALADLARLLSTSSDTGTALQVGADRLRQALRAPWVEVTSSTGLLACAGARPSWLAEQEVIAVPLVHLGEPCGTLRAGPRSPREPLSARDLALLGQLSGPLAAVVAAHQHLLDLQKSREAAVVAREEERRRVRLDLHDGVGPLLSAIVTHADVVRLRSADGASSLDGLLARIQHLSRDAVSGLRRVIDDLQPVGLDELGLGGALEEIAAVLTEDAGMRIEVAVPAIALSAAVELALYRIGAEALSNAVRHAGASHVVVRVGLSDVAAVLEVVDDGHGIGSTARIGVGMTSMRSRAEELGGTFAVISDAGGTRVTAEVPRHEGGLPS